MLDNSTVTMVVPGGPAYKPVDGKRIEKTDNVLAIDPDGKSGFKAVTPANVVALLRGPDKVGSHVKLQITKAGSTTPRDVAEFNLVRADFRQVEKIKDVFMKLAELAAAVNDGVSLQQKTWPGAAAAAEVRAQQHSSGARSARRSAARAATRRRTGPRPRRSRQLQNRGRTTTARSWMI